MKGVLYLRATPLLLFYFIVAVTLALLTDRVMVATFQVIAFLFLRYKFNTTYHASTSRDCFFVTMSIILLTIPTSPSIGKTLFGGVFMAFIISFCSWLVQYIIDLKEPKIVKIDLDTISEEDLRILCKNKHLNEENSQLAVEFFIKKTKHSILADQYCVEEKSITTRKKRLKKKLLE